MNDTQVQWMMRRQYLINRAILKILRTIDEELDFDTELFGCSDLDELKQLIQEQSEVING